MLIHNLANVVINIMGFKLRSGGWLRYNSFQNAKVHIESDIGSCTISLEHDDWVFENCGNLIAIKGKVTDINNHKSIAICDKTKRSKKRGVKPKAN